MNRYLTRYVPHHPRASASGDVCEHVLIAERACGRYLPVTVQVHHVDENKRNNANGNLVICQNAAYHKLLHARARVVKAGGNPNTERLCGRCKTLRPFVAFNRFKDGYQRFCRGCQSAYCKTYKRRKSEAA